MEYNYYGSGHRERRGRGARGYRGRGRGRGYRREGHDGEGYRERRNNWGGDRYNDGEKKERRGPGGCPAGLKGKEIGLYFAARGKKKKMEQELQSRTFIQMDRRRENYLSDLLANIHAIDKVPPQPNRSFMDSFSDEDSYEVPQQRKTTSSWSSYPNEYEDEESPSCSQPPDSWESRHLSPVDPREDTESPVAMTSSGHSFRKPVVPVSRYEQSDSDGSEEEDDSDDVDSYSQLADNAVKRSEVARDEDLTPDEDTDYDDNYISNTSMTEMLDMYMEDSDFMTEFKNHTLENRRSDGRLNSSNLPQIALRRDEGLDEKLWRDLKDKRTTSTKFKKMSEFRSKLPSYQMRETILEHVNNNQILVISGETGCGKTTQVAQFILDDYIERGEGSMCRVVCTQPRRISAISVAERVAEERGERCGEGSVGFQIRLESKLPRTRGSILYCTTGIMLKWLISDKWLKDTTHVILDEIHERDLQSDFLMIILKDLAAVRRDLKVILMSATLNAEQFSEYYGNCPMLNIPGFTYPVEEYLLEDTVELLKYRHNEGKRNWQPRRRVYGRQKREIMEERWKYEEWVKKLNAERYSLETQDVLRGMDTEEIDLDLIVELVHYITFNKSDGAILIFVPGWAQISDVHKKLQARTTFSSDRFRIIPLHSQMPTVNQREVFERPPPGVRKVIIATNIAETSITIDDVVYVIDGGKIKMKNFDSENNIATLKPEWVSRANAKQRRGRAGRVQPGECYHLYTAYQQEMFADYQLPEMLRTRLEELCLQIKILKLGRIVPFISKAMQQPSRESLQLSIQTLLDLNALDGNEDLTPLGYHLAKMPVDPHTGKMLLFGAMFSCLDPILTVAASLSFKDAFYIPLGLEKVADMRRRQLSEGTQSDHIMLANAYKGWERARSRGTARQYCRDNFLSEFTLKLLKDMRHQFTVLLREMKFLPHDDPKAREVNKHSHNHKILKAVICAGLYPNVAKLQTTSLKGWKPAKLQTKHEKIAIHPSSVNANEREFDSNWLLYHLKMKTVKIYLYDCGTVSPYALLFFGGNITVRMDSGQDCIVVDDWIVFRSSPRIARLVKELRVEMDKLLEYKITHPGVTNWNPREKEGALMTAMLELLTTEDHTPPSKRH